MALVQLKKIFEEYFTYLRPGQPQRNSSFFYRILPHNEPLTASKIQIARDSVLAVQSLESCGDPVKDATAVIRIIEHALDESNQSRQTHTKKGFMLSTSVRAFGEVKQTQKQSTYAYSPGKLEISYKTVLQQIRIYLEVNNQGKLYDDNIQHCIRQINRLETSDRGGLLYTEIWKNSNGRQTYEKLGPEGEVLATQDPPPAQEAHHHEHHVHAGHHGGPHRPHGPPPPPAAPRPMIPPPVPGM